MHARERLAIAERSRTLAGGNGARTAAALVEEMVLSVPAAATPPRAVDMVRRPRAVGGLR
jgi:hypothetical protein